MKSSMVKLIVLFCALLGNLALAVEDPNYPYANSEPEQMLQSISQMSSSVNLPFDPSNYNFLIYDCLGGENSIHQAMEKIGITEYTTCDKNNPVTANLLHTHDILIVGWAAGGDKAGLDQSIIEEGVSGRVILSGHDSDYHTVNVESEDAATTFFIQEIDYVLKGESTGLIVCADIDSNFDWLPDSWGVESTADGGSTITEFTQDGLNSGIYDNLTPALMSGWSTSFHNTFTSLGDGFQSFELGQGDVTVTIAAPINPNGFYFVKEDGLDDETECALPNDEITYTICYENITDQTFYDTYIVDFLPEEMDYPAGTGSYVFDGNSIQYIAGDPGYNEDEHYYVWDIGTIAPNDANCVSLTVTMNQKAEPGMLVHNIAELWGTIYDPNGQNPTEIRIARATEDTRVCCWGDPNIIYVDQSAIGLMNGTNWQDAYTDLGDALTRAAKSGCSNNVSVYVAQGTYDPNNTANKTFVLPAGCSVYGGFKSGGCDFSERNPKKYKTTLTGMIDDDAFPDAETLVDMRQDSLLDGFTVTHGFQYNIYGSGVDFTIAHCTITKSDFGHGIYAENGDVTIQWCTIQLNGIDGIQHKGEGYAIDVENSWILRNGEFGVNCEESTPQLRNSIVSESDLTLQGRAGVRLYHPTYQPVLHNLTISRNKSAGILFEDDGDVTGDPNNLDYPDLQNSIVYYNNPNGGKQLAGFSADTIANFCCIQDCNEPGTTNYNDEPGFAYVVDPNGAPDPNNYHLAYNSFCIDKGNDLDLDYTGQVDIDGEGIDRQYGEAVDIGADEVYNCGDDYLSDIDVHNDLDFNADGLVNFDEYTGFSAAWLSHDPNDPSLPTDPNLIDPNDFVGWSPAYNFDDTGASEYTIDLADFDVFLNNWLWVACWKLEEMEAAAAQSQSQSQSMMMEPLSISSFSAYSIASETTAITIEAEPETSLDTLVQVVGFLDEIIADEPDNIKNIQDLRAVLMDDIMVIWNREN